MDLLIKFGYLAVFLGAVVEGESVILTAGVLAYQGYFSLWKIIVISFLGTLCADQWLYHLGRLHGKKILKRWPKLELKSQKAFDLLHRYNTLYILSFRFIYGVRVISPAIIGMSGIPIWRFTILNLIAAAIWSSASCTAGYLLGKFGMEAWEQVKAASGQYYWIVPISVVLIIIFIVIFRRIRSRPKKM